LIKRKGIEMSTKSIMKVIIWGLGLLSMALGGCTTDRICLNKTDNISIEIIPNKKVEFLWIDVYEENGEAYIYGAVQRLEHSTAPIKIRIDIKGMSPEGATLFKTHSPDIWVPLRSISRRIDHATFHVSLPQIPSKDTLIKVICNINPDKLDK
jgi:hypothetical protein